MSSEGLDVKSLNAVIFASPKSDITQSIGRILSQKNPSVIPTTYDIIDRSIPVFYRQSLKRKRFYKKNNYNLIVHKVDDIDENNNLIEDYFTSETELENKSKSKKSAKSKTKKSAKSKKKTRKSKKKDLEMCMIEDSD